MFSFIYNFFTVRTIKFVANTTFNAINKERKHILDKNKIKLPNDKNHLDTFRKILAALTDRVIEMTEALCKKPTECY